MIPTVASRGRGWCSNDSGATEKGAVLMTPARRSEGAVLMTVKEIIKNGGIAALLT